MSNFEELKREYLNRQSQGNKNQLLLAIVAIVLIIVGIYVNKANQSFMAKAEETTGIVYYERDTIKSSSEEGDYYDVYVKYNVNGKEYYERLKGETLGKGSSFSKKSGKEITIYYNPDNPAEITDKSSSFAGIIIIAIGVIIIVAVIGDFIYRQLKGIKMDDPTPNYEGAEKVADFWEGINNKTGIFEKAETVGKTVSSIKKIIAVIICVLVILFGILSVFMDNEFSNNAKEIVATVSKIDKVERRNSDNKRYIDTEIYVSYNVDGKQYENKIDMKSEGITQGSKVNIYYNEKNPGEIKSTNKKKITGYIIIAIGVIFLLGFLLFPMA